MVWIPKVDEKPMAISFNNNKEFAFTSHAIGPWTNALDKMKKGDKIGIRGPYGNSFSLKNNACVIGGGIGMSSVSTLIDSLKNPLVINGARDKHHLLYLNRFKNMITSTDDGSHGKKGYTTDILKETIKNHNIKIVYTCGPELMMESIVEICDKNNIEVEVSLERYMSCGFGICGKCMVDDKIICVDGPIFNSKQLKEMKEFGKSARLKSGKKVTLKEYYSR